MGRLIDGKWVKKSIISSDEEGAYDRIPRSFRDKISESHDIFKPESGRYHLYVSFACPWAHRTLIFRKLKSLEDHIGVSVVHPDMLDMGWTFQKDFEGATGDDLYNYKYLSQLYQKADPTISTSVTVPVLWDKETHQIVNNESSEIIRIFNNAFNHITDNNADFYPENLRVDIDKWNEYIYDNVNNGVYRCGFAKTQAAYEKAAINLFQALDKLNEHFSNHLYLVGEQMTEADVRLITTLLRFEPVYFHHFKCAKRPLSIYKNLYEYTKRLYELPAIKETTNFEHIIRHYYYSHEELNPTRIVPIIETPF